MGIDSNKSLGSSYEEDFARILFENGFWVHLLRQTEAGQPADLIACRNGRTFLIDCKVCSNGNFPISRMEENQKLAMQAFMDAGNSEPWFALEVDGQTYMIPFHFMLRHPTPTLSQTQIMRYGETIEEWLGEWFTQ